MAFDRTQPYRNRGGPGGNPATSTTDMQQNAIDFDDYLEDVEVDDPDSFGICAALSVMYLAWRNRGGNRAGGLARMAWLESQTDRAVALQLAGEAEERKAKLAGQNKDAQIVTQIKTIARQCGLAADPISRVASGDRASIVVNILPRGSYVLDYETSTDDDDSHTIAVHSTPNTMFIFDPNCGEMRCPRGTGPQMWHDYWDDVASLGWAVHNVRILGCIGARTGLRMAVSIALTEFMPTDPNQRAVMHQEAPGMVPFAIKTFERLKQQ